MEPILPFWRFNVIWCLRIRNLTFVKLNWLIRTRSLCIVVLDTIEYKTTSIWVIKDRSILMVWWRWFQWYLVSKRWNALCFLIWQIVYLYQQYNYWYPDVLIHKRLISNTHIRQKSCFPEFHRIRVIFFSQKKFKTCL